MDQFNVIGENELTGNRWVFAGPMSKAEAVEIRRGAARLEADYKICYYVEAA